MVFAPFGRCFCLLVYRILISRYLRNCANLLLTASDGQCDGAQTAFGNIPCGHAQGIQRFRGIEIEHLREILRIKIFIRFQPAAAHQHIRRTVLQQTAIENRQIQLVQFFQQAVVPAILQIIKIVRHIVRRSVFHGGYYGFLQCAFIVQRTESVFQCFDHIRLLLGRHLPERHGAGQTAFVGVGYIKIILEARASRIVPIKYGNAGSALIDPSAELTIPALYLQHSRCVRTLCVYQHLLLKGQLIIPAGRAQKCRPPVCVGQCGDLLPVNLRDLLKSVRHRPSYRSLGFSRSFFGR